MSNRLKHESSLYLRQHAENPVDWYPWGKEAFEKAKSEDKPVFLSIGYSTCHWCHVMAHESFEDEEIADILNRRFVCVKVDKEERPDVDSIYMNFAQAFTGSGGWPTSVFMTWDGKPFFAGTYFPRVSRYGMIGMRELLYAILEKWDTDRDTLISQADEIIEHFKNTQNCARGADIEIVERAKSDFFRSYDSKNGGFGRAPKFPTPHNLLFLMGYYARYGDTACLDMVRHTLMQMYRGGIFDHFGYGFCRYSTDEYFLVPHFEKMLYDNALLILAYCRAHTLIKDTGLYLDIAEKTAKYILEKMTSAEGGFYTAEDADSEGEEGKYYVFTPKEITELLGERDGNAINSRYGITEEGNFEGKNIPNLLTSDPEGNSLDALIPRIEAYRRTRTSLHLDDKILTYPNSLMIAAMCELYRISSNGKYLEAARRADEFIKNNLIEDNTLYVSYRDGKRGVCGFLEDYAGYIFAQLALYRVTLDTSYIEVARRFLGRAISEFGDPSGGFYLYGEGGEKLILRPKVSYDGATPSGNSLIAYDMACLFNLTADPMIEKHLRSQLDFLMGESSEHPMGYAVFLMALLEYYEPGIKLTVVSDGTLDKERLVHLLPAYSSVIVLAEPTDEYPMKDGKTTYYLCQGHTCKPPTNDMPMLLGEGL